MTGVFPGHPLAPPRAPPFPYPSPTDIKKKGALVDVINALHVLHKHRVAHLDVKPSNIMRFGTDFKLVDVGSWGEFGSGVVPTYTLRYCSPEMMQFAFKNTRAVVRPAMDVFSLGVVAFELLSERGGP